MSKWIAELKVSSTEALGRGTVFSAELYNLLVQLSTRSDSLHILPVNDGVSEKQSG